MNMIYNNLNLWIFWDTVKSYNHIQVRYPPSADRLCTPLGSASFGVESYIFFFGIESYISYSYII